MIGRQVLIKNNTQVPTKYKDGASLDWFYFLTGNISFPKSIFVVEDGFSLDFKNYGWEDLELGYRFKKQEFHCVTLHQQLIIITMLFPIKRKQSVSIIWANQLRYSLISIRLKAFLGLNPISIFIRKRLSRQHIVYRLIQRLKDSKTRALRAFSYWFG